MYFSQFIDREDYLLRLRTALGRQATQFIVVYGRRRIGKSSLIRQVIDSTRGDVYFLSDQTTEAHQRAVFAKIVAESIEDFDRVAYPDWETMLRALNRQVSKRIIVCLDEFPYMVKSCPSLPSVIQKLINEHCLRFDLIICGSSQQLMQGYVLDRHEPLYGMADEIIRLVPMRARYICDALNCDAVNAVEEYAVWGGIPRYWELRADYDDRESAIRNLLLDPKGFLSEEPLRLLRDDMRDTVQSATLLSVIGNGANRISEIAARVERNVTQLTEPLGRLRDLGYIRREIPFGEDEKKSRKGLYYINDQLLAFNYRFVVPFRSLLELGGIDRVMTLVSGQFPQFAGYCWEHLCREFVSGNVIDGIAYNVASRWWGKVFADRDKTDRMVEIDVVAESIDRKHILIGECKWTESEDAGRIETRLSTLAPLLPFVKRGQTIHLAIFLKNRPTVGSTAHVFLPDDIMTR